MSAQLVQPAKVTSCNGGVVKHFSGVGGLPRLALAKKFEFNMQSPIEMGKRSAAGQIEARAVQLEQIGQVFFLCARAIETARLARARRPIAAAQALACARADALRVL